MNELVSVIADFMTTAIEQAGLFAVFLLMTVESAGVPFPSEITMPFAGFLSATDRLSFTAAVIAGGLANTLGSLAAYSIAKIGGRPLVIRFGRYLWFSIHDLERSERFFRSYGNLTVFVGRLLPIVRTYISFPAGLSQMPLGPFIIYTTVGSLIWSWLLVFIGFRLGSQWPSLKARVAGIEYLIGLGLLVGLIYWVSRHRRANRASHG